MQKMLDRNLTYDKEWILQKIKLETFPSGIMAFVSFTIYRPLLYYIQAYIQLFRVLWHNNNFNNKYAYTWRATYMLKWTHNRFIAKQHDSWKTNSWNYFEVVELTELMPEIIDLQSNLDCVVTLKLILSSPGASSWAFRYCSRFSAEDLKFPKTPRILFSFLRNLPSSFTDRFNAVSTDTSFLMPEGFLDVLASFKIFLNRISFSTFASNVIHCWSHSVVLLSGTQCWWEYCLKSLISTQKLLVRSTLRQHFRQLSFAL